MLLQPGFKEGMESDAADTRPGRYDTRRKEQMTLLLGEFVFHDPPATSGNLV